MLGQASIFHQTHVFQPPFKLRRRSQIEHFPQGGDVVKAG